MRIRMIGVVGASALALLLAACGTVGGKAASQVRPAAPINLTVYVNNSRVSVSPTSLGAGPVVFIVTNQASSAQALAISRSGASHPLATTAPINPQGTTQVAVNFRPGTYTVATTGQGSTDAALSVTPPIRAASLHIGRTRSGSSNQLLQP